MITKRRSTGDATFKMRPLAWRIDDYLGTTPLFDLAFGGAKRWSPMTSRRATIHAIVVHLRDLLRPSGRAYLRWHWMYKRDLGTEAERDHQYLCFLTLRRQERKTDIESAANRS